MWLAFRAHQNHTEPPGDARSHREQDLGGQRRGLTTFVDGKVMGKDGLPQEDAGVWEEPIEPPCLEGRVQLGGSQQGACQRGGRGCPRGPDRKLLREKRRSPSGLATRKAQVRPAAAGGVPGRGQTEARRAQAGVLPSWGSFLCQLPGAGLPACGGRASASVDWKRKGPTEGPARHLVLENRGKAARDGLRPGLLGTPKLPADLEAGRMAGAKHADPGRVFQEPLEDLGEALVSGQ